jgi:hypothetical protein
MREINLANATLIDDEERMRVYDEVRIGVKRRRWEDGSGAKGLVD